MRDHLKAIRTREESLDDLERRRRSLLRKVEDADKKLSKMSTENKHFPMQSDTLNRLREDVRAMDSEIMLGEEDKIEIFVAEAYRDVNMVTLSTFPSSSDAPAFYIMSTDYGESSNIRSSSLSSELQPLH